METLEEGQISHASFSSGGGYDPALEWPGDTDHSHTNVDDLSTNDARPSAALSQGQPVFRLVALRSGILSKRKKIAVIDAYHEVQFGRDIQMEGSTIPRIRLKEMQVSKLHATAFWDGARKEWSIVDMGSMHGTFLRPAAASSDSNDVGVRLSQSRAASIPRRLHHFDQLTLGSTSFQVHIHDNQRPCPNCAIQRDEEIPLFPEVKSTAEKRTRDTAGIDSGSTSSGSLNMERDPKKVLTMLKRSLLNRHDETTPSPGLPPGRPNDYIDRAARRRLLHPTSRSDSPGVFLTVPNNTPRADTAPFHSHFEPEVQPIVSQPPKPLPSTNIGHRLLMQQGWTPGNALGTTTDDSESSTRLVEPLEVKSSQNRAGLGTKPVSGVLETDSRLDWKERERLRRFGKYGK